MENGKWRMENGKWKIILELKIFGQPNIVLAFQAKKNGELKLSANSIFNSPFSIFNSQFSIPFYQPRIHANISGATMEASDSMMNLGV
jgi:hypothetical protein